MSRSIEALVDEQARRWAVRRGESPHEERQPVVTVARMHGARGDALADGLVSALRRRGLRPDRGRAVRDFPPAWSRPDWMRAMRAWPPKRVSSVSRTVWKRPRSWSGSWKPLYDSVGWKLKMKT